MEINEALIKKAAEHVMLNSCSVSSSGLFNGKAGMSLALFEVARFLEDEYIEDQAYRHYRNHCSQRQMIRVLKTVFPV